MKLLIFIRKLWLELVAFAAALSLLVLLLWPIGTYESTLQVLNPFGKTMPIPGKTAAETPDSMSWNGTVSGSGRWYQAAEVRFFFATYHQDVAISGAVLQIGDHCRFSADASVLKDNAFFSLKSTSECELSGDRAQEFTLRVAFNEEQRQALAVWAHEGWKGSGFFAQEIKGVWILQDQLVHTPKIYTSRYQLLAYIWQDAGHLLKFVLAAAGLCLLIFLYLTRTERYDAAVACLFLVCSLVITVFVPPFQAADEPDHFLSFLRINNFDDYKAKALDFANRGNFIELKQNPAGTFTPYDIASPKQNPWDMNWQERIIDSQMQTRSPLTSWFWRIPAFVGRSLDTGSLLLLLRLLNGLLVTSAVFLIGKVLTYSFHVPGLGQFLILAPALPYFSVHVSNYPPLIFITISTISCAFSVDRKSRKISSLLAFLTGFLCILSAMISRLGILITPLAASILIGVAGTNLWRRKCTLSAYFAVSVQIFIPFIIGFSTIIFFHDMPPIVSLSATAGKALHQILPTFLLEKPMTSWLGIAVGIVATAAFSAVAIFQYFINKYPRLQGNLRTALCYLPFIFAVFWLFLLFLEPCHLPDIEKKSPSFSAVEYTIYGIRTFISDLTPAGNDFLVSISFWTGFGWLETHFPEWFSRTIKLTPVILMGIGMWIGRHRLKNWWWLAVLFCGLFTVFCGLAIGSYQVRYNLHGRYLLTFYCGYLVAIALAYQNLFPAANHRRKSIQSIISTYVLCTQTYAWHWVLFRYFP